MTARRLAAVLAADIVLHVPALQALHDLERVEG
jgi:hypothetical protein